VTLERLRHFAVARTLFAPLPLQEVIDRLGFVQADPIRAPARAQDLILRHRVDGYRAGDLERRYRQVDVEEDVFVNYGFVSRQVHALMHPREKLSKTSTRRPGRAQKVLAFVREKGEVHPAAVHAHFSHGTVTNYWGGSSNATTHLLDKMHYWGWLRVTRRERGVRLYAARDEIRGGEGLAPRERVDKLVDVVVSLYAPLPSPSLSFVVGRLRYAVPQWRGLIRTALARARKRLERHRVDGTEWYWPGGEQPHTPDEEDIVRILAPFDPLVWDRRRFELFWRWPYRFEAYTPAAKRRFGYYAMPVLWRSNVIGWANLSVVDGTLRADLGYTASPPQGAGYRRALDAELYRIGRFLDL
jgi:uncharacterized protein